MWRTGQIVTPMPVIEHMATASVAEYIAPAPTVDSAPAPVIEHMALASACDDNFLERRGVHWLEEITETHEG